MRKCVHRGRLRFTGNNQTRSVMLLQIARERGNPICRNTRGSSRTARPSGNANRRSQCARKRANLPPVRAPAGDPPSRPCSSACSPSRRAGSSPRSDCRRAGDSQNPAHIAHWSSRCRENRSRATRPHRPDRAGRWDSDSVRTPASRLPVRCKGRKAHARTTSPPGIAPAALSSARRKSAKSSRPSECAAPRLCSFANRRVRWRSP